MRQLGKIQCIEVLNNDNPQDETPWVILFHGYGADASDLSSLADVIPTKKTFNYLFPTGILQVPIGPGWTGRAWWTIDMNAIEKARLMGTTRDMAEDVPADLAKVRTLAMNMISQLNVPWSKIILGGFSQGAMLAQEIYAHAPETPAGLVLLSGTLINQNELKEKMKTKAGGAFFQSHGESDMVLGVKQARRLEGLLQQAGLKGSCQTFNGAHEIPMSVLTRLGSWLDLRSV